MLYLCLTLYQIIKPMELVHKLVLSRKKIYIGNDRRQWTSQFEYPSPHTFIWIRCHVKTGTPQSGDPRSLFSYEIRDPCPHFHNILGILGPHFHMRMGTLPWKRGPPCNFYCLPSSSHILCYKQVTCMLKVVKINTKLTCPLATRISPRTRWDTIMHWCSSRDHSCHRLSHFLPI